MERVLHYLLLELCTARNTSLEQWYKDGWEFAEKVYDDNEKATRQMASGTEPVLAESRDAELLRSPIGQVHQPLLVTGSQLETSQDHNTGTVSRNSVGV